ncbi:GL25991 [Drosophila persimilis]|uniref:GL25991 n=1 Tax=Drosophila persimilis TaxID=7234 RepID=B4GK24_DROPE|nr:GL25991 [Drosophila persimilis]
MHDHVACRPACLLPACCKEEVHEEELELELDLKEQQQQQEQEDECRGRKIK